MIEYWMRASSMDATSGREVGKKPSSLFAAYECNCLSVYRETQREGEDIIARWVNEPAAGYASEEFYSDNELPTTKR